MKKYLILIGILGSFFCQAQSTYSLTNSFNRDIYKNNNYIMDIDGILDKFVGTWKWIDLANPNTYFEIEFIKVLHSNPKNILPFFRDMIIGNYKYVVNGVLITSTLGNTNLSSSANFPAMLSDISDLPFKDLTINMKDVIKQKSCFAEFEIINLGSSPMSATWQLRDREGMYRGFRQPGFSIPTNIILTKM